MASVVTLSLVVGSTSGVVVAMVGGTSVVGHSGTHSLVGLLRKVPLGHWQPRTHCTVQNRGCSSPHTAGHAVPHSMNSCPLVSHASTSGVVGGVSVSGVARQTGHPHGSSRE